MSEKKFKNEREMWHGIDTFSSFLSKLAKFKLQSLYSACIHYHYDAEASEVACVGSEGAREKRGFRKDFLGKMVAKDFEPDEECWQCEFYTTECSGFEPRPEMAHLYEKGENGTWRNKDGR